MKPWYTSKSIHSAVGKLVGGIVLAIERQDWTWILLSLWGIYDAWVRWKTTQPIT